MLDNITPVILTLDEEPNIARCLEKLTWAREVVVVDSLSGDRTREIATSFPNVRFLQRAFDTHAEQWSFAVHETRIESEWVLALDADYILTEVLLCEIGNLKPPDSLAAFRCTFRYCVLGEPIGSSLYPPVTILYRRRRSRYIQDGHTQRVVVDGPVVSLRAVMLHDDRKDLARWLGNQERYMRAEANTIVNTPLSKLSWADRARRIFVAPPLVFFYLLLCRGLVLEGRRGLYYAMQRTLAELLLCIQILEVRIMSGLRSGSARLDSKRQEGHDREG